MEEGVENSLTNYNLNGKTKLAQKKATKLNGTRSLGFVN